MYSLSTIQLTLPQTNDRSTKWNSDRLEQIMGKGLLIHWLCDGLLPYSTVINDHSKK